MNNFPTKFIDLLTNEAQAYLFLATTMPDGSPQVTPVWFNTDGEHILINTSAGRTKDRNMSARPQVALVIMKPQEPFRYLQIRGRVIERTTQGAKEHINALSIKYTAKPWDSQPGQTRVLYKIRAEHFDQH